MYTLGYSADNSDSTVQAQLGFIYEASAIRIAPLSGVADVFITKTVYYFENILDKVT